LPSRHRIKLIFNPAAGRGATLRAVSRIQSCLAGLGADFDLEITSEPKEATAIARRAVRAHYRVVAAVGGDGTVNEVATSLVDTESVLGVVPIGNGNDFFRITGIDPNLEACCHALVRGRFRRIDVGSLGEGTYFFNALGLGLNADAAKRAVGNRLLRGLPLYLCAALRTIPLHRPAQMKLRIEDYELEGSTTLVAVGNGTSTGGGFRLTPFASPEDGLLDVCLIGEVSKLKILYYLPRVLKGSIPHIGAVKMFRARKIEVESEIPLPVHLDGEILNTDLRGLRVDVLPKKLKVISKA
jgi:diacylglycerol kinase (ATP)